MGYSTMSYSVEGSSQLLNKIEKIMRALGECQCLGLNINMEQDKLIVYADYGGVDYVVEWTALVNEALKKMGCDKEQYHITGVIDYDYGEYKAFCIDTNINEIRKKELEFFSGESIDDEQEEGSFSQNATAEEIEFLRQQGIEIDDEYEELKKSESSEEGAFKRLEKEEYVVVTDIEVNEYEFEDLMEVIQTQKDHSN